MIDLDEIQIDKETLNHNDRVLCLDICEYAPNNPITTPFIATIKRTDSDMIYFECDDKDDVLYSDNVCYIVIKILEDRDSL